jgi:hypothetical protein
LPPTWTVAQVPVLTGALNGIGGPGCGAPEAGFGTRWIAQVAVMRSPSTAAGVPMVDRSPSG